MQNSAISKENQALNSLTNLVKDWIEIAGKTETGEEEIIFLFGSQNLVDSFLLPFFLQGEHKYSIISSDPAIKLPPVAILLRHTQLKYALP